MPPQEIETQEPVHTGAGGQRVAEDRKIQSLDSESLDSLDRDLGCEFDAAAGRDLLPSRGDGGIISKQDGDIPVD